MSASTIIGKFGGVKALAEKLGQHSGTKVPLTTVQYWADIDRIPSGRQAQVLETAEEFGIDVTPADFFNVAAA